MSPGGYAYLLLVAHGRQDQGETILYLSDADGLARPVRGQLFTYELARPAFIPRFGQLTKFLEYAARLFILRKVGGGYSIIYTDLQEQFVKKISADLSHRLIRQSSYIGGQN